MSNPAQIRTSPSASPNAAPELRRLPTRHVEPPFDDDVAGASGYDGVATPSRTAVQGTLALAFAMPTGVPAIPAAPGQPFGGRRLRLVPTPPDEPVGRAGSANGRGRTGAVGRTDNDFGPQPTARALLPEPRLWAGRLVQAVIEVTVGTRPLAQLLRWTTTDVYESVRCRVAHAGAVATSAPVAPRVRSVHVSEPRDSVAEICAVVQYGLRCRAVALRLEGLDGRWQCTALQVC